MPTRSPYVDVLRLPWSELLARVAVVAATGDRRARSTLKAMVDQERRARRGSRDDPGVIARLATRAVLDNRHTRSVNNERSLSNGY
jgi:hypothetical protein